MKMIIEVSSLIILIESILFCLIFTIMVFIMAKNPIKTLYNYPPIIQKRVEEIEEYKNFIPTNKDKIGAKILASLIIIFIFSLVLRYINGYTNFQECFINSFLLWTIVNIYDVLVLDICWFCKSDRFVFKGTEDIISEYKNYWFHIKEGLIGEGIGLILCIIISLVVGYIL